jgi:hypothetical protein
VTRPAADAALAAAAGHDTNSTSLHARHGSRSRGHLASMRKGYFRVPGRNLPW